MIIMCVLIPVAKGAMFVFISLSRDPAQAFVFIIIFDEHILSSPVHVHYAFKITTERRVSDGFGLYLDGLQQHRNTCF